MFYSQFILAKKGPLGTIWIAAHLERKLRKNQVADTDIGVSVDSILCPDVPIALRLSSHLLLGVARIYSKKVNYLFDDCSEALLKVKQAFRSAAVDLPPEESKAPYHSITLPETFELDDFELPDNDIFHGNYVDNHISSREQITLQDTLDGVTYSTSKFGLDERFGDGDASGLDLDEELFLAKIDAAGIVNERSDPVASVGPMTPLKQDEHPESRSANSGTRVDDVGDNADLMDYAHAPCTPRLVEGPNLPNVLEVSACDDHMELEYHLGESKMMDNAKKNIYGDKQEVDWSSQNNKNSDVVPMVLPEEDYGHPSGSLVINSSKPEGEFPVDTNKEHVPFMEDLQSGQVDKDINSVLPIDENDHRQGPCETGFVKSSCEIPGLASALDQGESFPQNHETLASNEPGDSSSLNLHVHENVASSESPFMRPCNSNIDQRDLISGCALSADAAERSDVTELITSEREKTIMIGNVCPGADNSEEFPKENHSQEHGAALNERDSQVMNASTHDSLVDNLNNSAETNLPAPEKMLSVPEDIADQHNNLSSPKEFIGLDTSDAGSKVVSGKKRSFTESTLTEQSLNSVESSRLVHFKRTTESLPHDDDLLSSILVGRSSVLKVKSTPRPSELASNKRVRSAPRTGGPKRKVLMDDTMVLHGDTIRQQLTNSDDIRRVRRKAPCTPSEISLLQKQYLEDESFLEPLFTGMSLELVSLHSQTRDLSGIRIIANDLNDSFPESVTDLRLPSENIPLPTATPILCPDGAKNDDSPTTAAEADSTAQKAENFESLDMENDKDSGRDNVAEQSGVKTTNELSSATDIGINEIREMNVEVNTCNEQSKADGDVYADVLRQEPLLDVGGVETRDRNNDGSITFLNADTSADLCNQDRNALSANFHFETVDADKGEAVSEDGLTARDGDANANVNVNAVFETEPLDRDDVLLEEARESATVERQFYEHNEMHYAVVRENIEYSTNAAPQEDDFMEYGRSPEHPEAHHRYMVQDQNVVAAGNDNDIEFLNFDDDDELNEMADDHIPDEEEARFMENTGWSSRTRAVSKYLQTLFVKEAEQGISFHRESLSRKIAQGSFEDVFRNIGSENKRLHPRRAAGSLRWHRDKASYEADEERLLIRVGRKAVWDSLWSCGA